jgi:acyl-CoA thioesterase-1
MRYVALGDSYTVGTSLDEAGSWPAQLAARLGELELVANLGVNGATSGDLIRDQLPRLEDLRPELVSVLIGVNDVVQGEPAETYGANASQLLDTLLALLPADRVFCLATPDYTVTRQGADYGVPELQRAAILRNNEILRGASEDRSVPFVPEIFEISRDAGDDPAMLSDDGLHPSAAQYARWVDAIEPVVRPLLEA